MRHITFNLTLSFENAVQNEDIKHVVDRVNDWVEQSVGDGVLNTELADVVDFDLQNNLNI